MERAWSLRTAALSESDRRGQPLGLLGYGAIDAATGDYSGTFWERRRIFDNSADI
jgi:hypothetical protein